MGCASLIVTDDLPTSKTVILLIEGQNRRHIHTFGANAAFRAEHVTPSFLEGLDVFYLGGLFAMPGIDARALANVLQYCRSKGIVTVVDVVISEQFDRPQDIRAILSHIDFFLPNDDEAQKLTQCDDPMEQVRTLRAWGAGTVILTRGGEGCLAAREDEVWQAGAYAFNAVDPSGGGDAFDAGVIAATLQGWDLPRILTYASAIGGSATLAVGTTDAVWDQKRAEAYVAGHPLEVVRVSQGG